MNEEGTSHSVVVDNDDDDDLGGLNPDRTEVLSGNGCLLNKYGYPKGEGKESLEKKGPYLYVLCTIKLAHYEENEVFWTVVREDNGFETRGDVSEMTPIPTQEGLKAAQNAAALSRAIASGRSIRSDDENGGGPHQTKNKETLFSRTTNCLCVTCCLPFFCTYQCLGLVKESAAYKRFMHGVRMFLDGNYRISFRVTSVNLIVLVSIWYLFIDDIRLAFLHPSVDDNLAFINFIVWLVLVLELLFFQHL